MLNVYCIELCEKKEKASSVIRSLGLLTPFQRTNEVFPFISLNDEPSVYRFAFSTSDRPGSGNLEEGAVLRHEHKVLQ